MSKHTPGPWIIEQSDSYPHLAKLKRPYAGSQLFDIADARLIAAAPDLLETLRDLVMLAAQYRGNAIRESVQRARGAITKAVRL